MATTVLVKEVLWRVSVLCGDIAPQFQRFTEGELVRWLMDGQVAICKFVPSAGSRVDAIKLVPGTKQSIDTVLAANCVPGDGIALTAPLYGIQLYAVTRNMGTDGLTPGRTVNIVDRQALANIDETWHTTVSTFMQDYVFDERLPTVFYVYPGVSAALPFYAEIEWSAMPKLINNSGSLGSERYLIGGAATDTITIHDKYVDDLVNYVMARAQLKDAKFAEATKSQAYGAWFAGSISTQVKALTGSNPNVQILPGETRS